MKFWKWMNTKKECLAFLTKLSLLFILIIPHSHARFMVEPFYKIYSGEFETGNDTGKISASMYGANIGYIGKYFMAGFSVENGSLSSDSTLTSSGSKEFQGGGIGTYMGFHFLDKWKIWTGYLNSALEPNNNNDIRYFGQHVSFGLGYRVWEGLIINIEGFRNQYTQQEDDITGKTQGLDTKIKTNGASYFLSYFLVF